MKKRGLSKAVSTTLLVVLVLVACSILLGVVTMYVKDELSLERRSSLKIVTERGYTYWDSVEKVACVQTGLDFEEQNLTGIEVLFSIKGNTEKFYFRNSNLPGPGETRKECFNLTDFGRPDKVSVAPIYLIGDVEETLGIVSIVDNFYEGIWDGGLLQEQSWRGSVQTGELKVKIAMESALWKYWAEKDKWDGKLDGNYTDYLDAENEEFVRLGVEYKIMFNVNKNELEQEVKEAKKYGLKIIAGPREITYKQEISDVELSSKLEGIDEYVLYLKGRPEILEGIAGFWIADDTHLDRENHASIRDKIKEHFPDVPLVITPVEAANYLVFFEPYPDIAIGQSYPWWPEDTATGEKKSDEEIRQQVENNIEKLRTAQESMGVEIGIFAQGFGFYGEPLVPRASGDNPYIYHYFPPAGDLYWQLKQAYDSDLKGYYSIFTSMWPSPAGQEDEWSGVWDYHILFETRDWEEARTRLWGEIYGFINDYGG